MKETWKKKSEEREAPEVRHTAECTVKALGLGVGETAVLPRGHTLGDGDDRVERAQGTRHLGGKAPPATEEVIHNPPPDELTEWVLEVGCGSSEQNPRLRSTHIYCCKRMH